MGEFENVCIHEASHVVFGRLMQKLDIGFPDPEYIKIHSPLRGETLRSLLPENNTENAYQKLKEIKEKGITAQIAQIMYSMAGFVSHQQFIDAKIDECQLDKMIINSRRFPSDIDKCNKIAGQITGHTRVGKSDDRRKDWIINKQNLELLNSIKESIVAIMQELNVRVAIRYLAEIAFQKRVLEGRELKVEINVIDKILNSVDITQEIGKHL